MDIHDLSNEFPITRQYNFLDNAAVAPISRRAAQAMHAYVDQAQESGPVDSEWYARADRVRQLAAQLLNASTEEVTFIKNTSEGLSFVANGLPWHQGDNVVTAAGEFPANIYPWMNLAPRGVQLKMVPEHDGCIPLEQLIEAIDSRTRLVTISAVQFASGFRTDLAALGHACRQKGVLLCVDAIQALGVLPIDVQAMQIDFLSADGHKWLCGPEGAGIFYCRRELLGQLHPSTPGWVCMVDAKDYGRYHFEFRPDARRFDSGSYNIAGILGLGGSLELLLELGVDRIARHVLDLTDRLAAGLTGKGYRVISDRSPTHASGIVAFASGRHDHSQIRQWLHHQHRVIISCRRGRLRASPHVYNTPRQIDELIELLPAHGCAAACPQRTSASCIAAPTAIDRSQTPT
ncbi:MAG TPA: aminotransferase class V-fold PLP-dependent enzyme [Phycisphaerae bacterium]|nr:aminotransferase class V-fold PLP-dependent enzyme [Phycisphaerae bacterium]